MQKINDIKNIIVKYSNIIHDIFSPEDISVILHNLHSKLKKESGLQKARQSFKEIDGWYWQIIGKGDDVLDALIAIEEHDKTIRDFLETRIRLYMLTMKDIEHISRFANRREFGGTLNAFSDDVPIFGIDLKDVIHIDPKDIEATKKLIQKKIDETRRILDDEDTFHDYINGRVIINDSQVKLGSDKLLKIWVERKSTMEDIMDEAYNSVVDYKRELIKVKKGLIAIAIALTAIISIIGIIQYIRVRSKDIDRLFRSLVKGLEGSNHKVVQKSKSELLKQLTLLQIDLEKKAEASDVTDISDVLSDFIAQVENIDHEDETSDISSLVGSYEDFKNITG